MAKDKSPRGHTNRKQNKLNKCFHQQIDGPVGLNLIPLIAKFSRPRGRIIHRYQVNWYQVQAGVKSKHESPITRTAGPEDVTHRDSTKRRRKRSKSHEKHRQNKSKLGTIVKEIPSLESLAISVKSVRNITLEIVNEDENGTSKTEDETSGPIIPFYNKTVATAMEIDAILASYEGIYAINELSNCSEEVEERNIVHNRRPETPGSTCSPEINVNSSTMRSKTLESNCSEDMCENRSSSHRSKSKRASTCSSFKSRRGSNHSDNLETNSSYRSKRSKTHDSKTYSHKSHRRPMTPGSTCSVDNLEGTGATIAMSTKVQSHCSSNRSRRPRTPISICSGDTDEENSASLAKSNELRSRCSSNNSGRPRTPLSIGDTEKCSSPPLMTTEETTNSVSGNNEEASAVVIYQNKSDDINENSSLQTKTSIESVEVKSSSGDSDNLSERINTVSSNSSLLSSKCKSSTHNLRNVNEDISLSSLTEVPSVIALPAGYCDDMVVVPFSRPTSAASKRSSLVNDVETIQSAISLNDSTSGTSLKQAHSEANDSCNSHATVATSTSGSNVRSSTDFNMSLENECSEIELKSTNSETSTRSDGLGNRQKRVKKKLLALTDGVTTKSLENNEEKLEPGVKIKAAWMQTLAKLSKNQSLKIPTGVPTEGHTNLQSATPSVHKPQYRPSRVMIDAGERIKESLKVFMKNKDRERLLNETRRKTRNSQ